MMNSDLLEIFKNYLDICSFFNEKLEEIKADEILNMNLELLKVSIMDLNINLANFKSDLKTKQSSNQTNLSSSSSPNSAYTGDNYTELDKKNLLALFFMYLMQIDKDSIL